MSNLVQGAPAVPATARLSEEKSQSANNLQILNDLERCGLLQISYTVTIMDAAGNTRSRGNAADPKAAKQRKAAEWCGTPAVRQLHDETKKYTAKHRHESHQHQFVQCTRTHGQMPKPRTCMPKPPQPRPRSRCRSSRPRRPRERRTGQRGCRVTHPHKIELIFMLCNDYS